MKTLLEKEVKIANFILKLNTPFKISELYQKLEESNVSTDKEKILDILDQLCESGLVSGKELLDGSWGYERNKNQVF